MLTLDPNALQASENNIPSRRVLKCFAVNDNAWCYDADNARVWVAEGGGEDAERNKPYCAAISKLNLAAYTVRYVHSTTCRDGCQNDKPHRICYKSDGSGSRHRLRRVHPQLAQRIYNCEEDAPPLLPLKRSRSGSPEAEPVQRRRLLLTNERAYEEPRRSRSVTPVLTMDAMDTMDTMDATDIAVSAPSPESAADSFASAAATAAASDVVAAAQHSDVEDEYAKSSIVERLISSTSRGMIWAKKYMINLAKRSDQQEKRSDEHEKHIVGLSNRVRNLELHLQSQSTGHVTPRARPRSRQIRGLVRKRYGLPDDADIDKVEDHRGRRLIAKLNDLQFLIGNANIVRDGSNQRAIPPAYQNEFWVKIAAEFPFCMYESVRYTPV